MLRRTFLQTLTLAALSPVAAPSRAARLAAAARGQVGVTDSYDPTYRRLAYPNGDVPRTTGVCADVIIRAYRDALALDLQRLVHDDMAAHFSAYPRKWGSHGADPNIDHRRVLNLETYWRRNGAQLWAADAIVPGNAFPAPVRQGDVVTWLLNGTLPHVGLVVSTDAGQADIVHNIGRGAECNSLDAFREQRAAGHYRWQL